MRPSRAATLVAAAVLALGALSACSSTADDPAASPTTGPAGSLAPDTSAPARITTTSLAKVTCSVPSLLEPVSERFPASALDHVACRDHQAVVTIQGGEVNGLVVGFLTSDDSAWTLVAVAESGDDPAQVRPAEIRDDVFTQWQELSARLPSVARPVPDPNQTTTTRSTTTIKPLPACAPTDPTCTGE